METVRKSTKYTTFSPLSSTSSSLSLSSDRMLNPDQLDRILGEFDCLSASHDIILKTLIGEYIYIAEGRSYTCPFSDLTKYQDKLLSFSPYFSFLQQTLLLEEAKKNSKYLDYHDQFNMKKVLWNRYCNDVSEKKKLV
jgi:hypothetical protein